MKEKRLIDANALGRYISDWQMSLPGDNRPNWNTAAYDTLKDVLDAINEAPTLEAVQWHDGLPPEHDSIFAQYKGTDKWIPSMFEKASEKVLVTIEHKSGSRMTIVSMTIDGKWRDIPLANETKVVAWAEMPAPKKGERA